MTEQSPSSEGSPARTPGVHREIRDVNVVNIVAVGIGLVVIGILIHLAADRVFDSFTARHRESSAASNPLAAQERGKRPAPPRLEGIDRMDATSPPTGLYPAEQRRLESYGWVDAKKGIVHIPIDRAMKVIVEGHRLPARPVDAKVNQYPH